MFFIFGLTLGIVFELFDFGVGYETSFSMGVACIIILLMILLSCFIGLIIEGTFDFEVFYSFGSMTLAMIIVKVVGLSLYTRMKNKKDGGKTVRTTKKELLEMLEDVSDNAEIILQVRGNSTRDYSTEERVVIEERFGSNGDVVIIKDKLSE